jgi:3-dehydroquinate synthase
MKKVNIALEGAAHEYSIGVEFGLLESAGEWARAALPAEARKVILVTNAKVFSLYGGPVETKLSKAGFEVFVWKMGDGERFKNFSSLEKALSFFGETRITRSDGIIALGGGVLGDLAGFAAAIYQRGIPFLQIPTTLLAMIDSSVGGKTAVNTAFGKNMIGAFHQPSAVLIDPATLNTLDRRELTAGFCEAVKQGAVGSRSLFEQTADFLRIYPPAKILRHSADERFRDHLENLLAAHVRFKAEIVAGDERESTNRSDGRSRKILNFGHTTAHALEKVTGYKRFKHGEAVGYGIMAAAEISKTVANFVQDELKLFNDVVRLTGVLPAADDIDIKSVIDAFVFDKKASGASLNWILLERIGTPKIVDSSDIPKSTIESALQKVLRHTSTP